MAIIVINSSDQLFDVVSMTWSLLSASTLYGWSQQWKMEDPIMRRAGYRLMAQILIYSTVVETGFFIWKAIEHSYCLLFGGLLAASLIAPSAIVYAVTRIAKNAKSKSR